MGLRGYGVDAGAALDNSKIVGRAWASIARKPMVGEGGDGARQGVYGVGDAVIAPTMPARTANSYVKTAAGKRLGSDVVGVGSVKNQKDLNPAASVRLPA